MDKNKDLDETRVIEEYTEVISDSTIEPSIDEWTGYEKRRQSEVTMARHSVDGGKSDQFGIVKAEYKNFSLTLPAVLSREQSERCKMLIDMAEAKLIDPLSKDPAGLSGTISLYEYLDKRGLSRNMTGKYRAKLAGRIKDGKVVELGDVQVIRQSEYTYIEGLTNKRGEYVIEKNKGLREFDTFDYENGKITFKFNPLFAKVALNRGFAAFPDGLYRVDLRVSPGAYSLGVYICQERKQNLTKSNRNILSVRNLLDHLKYIPSYNEVMSTDRAVQRRIIDPLYTALNEISDKCQVTYEFHYPGKGDVVPYDLRGSAGYKEIIEWMVWFEWSLPYPGEQRLINESTERAAIEKEAEHKFKVSERAREKRRAARKKEKEQ